MKDFDNLTTSGVVATVKRPFHTTFGYEAAIHFDMEAARSSGTSRVRLSSQRIVLKPELVRTVAALADLGPLPTLEAGSKAERRRRKAAAKQAKTLPQDSIKDIERYIEAHSRSVASDLLKFRLSLRAGLRAGEISALHVSDMVAVNGRISDSIEVRTLKQRYKNRTREIAMHADVREAFAELRKQHPSATYIAFSIGRDGQPRHQSAGCVANWFFRLYKNVGLLGCSSHSGRRTFATDLARQIALHQGSLRDLQEAMGHARLNSTECYLEPSPKMREMIMGLGS